MNNSTVRANAIDTDWSPKLAAAQVEVVELRRVLGACVAGPFPVLTDFRIALDMPTVAQPLLEAIAKVATEAELYRTGREKGYGDLNKAIAALAPWAGVKSGP